MTDLASHLTGLTGVLLGHLTDTQRHTVMHSFDGPERTQWTYLPRPRPGVPLHELTRPARKIVHQMLAAVLSRPAFAQAVTIMAWEEVLDADEHGRRNRCSDDYRIALFGAPGDPVWAWRFEGHHLSATATLATTLTRTHVTAAPVFLGTNPARIHAGSRLVLAPLGVEEDLARALLTALPARLRDRAITRPDAPTDLHSGTRPALGPADEPAGVAARDLPGSLRPLLDTLLGLYLDRLTPLLAAHLTSGLRGGGLDAYFAWEGHPDPGHDHAYRIQTLSAPGEAALLAEYCNTSGGGHAHTVLRLPGRDFGAHHLASASGPTADTSRGGIQSEPGEARTGA